MTAPIRITPEITMVQRMIEYRRICARSRCRVKAWKITDAQAWQLAAEAFLYLGSKNIGAIVASMKRGEVMVLGGVVNVIPPAPIVVNSSAWTGR